MPLLNNYTDPYCRLSYTPLSDTLNVAHVIFYLDQVGLYIDLTGPLSSLPDAYVSDCREWLEDECAGN